MPRIAVILRFLFVESIIISLVVLCVCICTWLIPEPNRILGFLVGGVIAWFLVHISYNASSRFKPYCDRIIQWTFKIPNENQS